MAIESNADEVEEYVAGLPLGAVLRLQVTVPFDYHKGRDGMWHASAVLPPMLNPTQVADLLMKQNGGLPK